MTVTVSVAQRIPDVHKSARQHDNLRSRMERPARCLLLPLEPLIDVGPLECGVLQVKGGWIETRLGTGAWTAACSASIIMAAGEGCEGCEVDFPDEMMAAA